MPTTCKIGTLDLNDKTNYRLLEGYEIGARPLSADWYISYTGYAAQANVIQAEPIVVTLPILVLGTSRNDVYQKVAAINTVLQFPPYTVSIADGMTYNLTALYSPQVTWVRDGAYINGYAARVGLTLYCA